VRRRENAERTGQISKTTTKIRQKRQRSREKLKWKIGAGFTKTKQVAAVRGK
jgi:hypothetical protein